MTESRTLIRCGLFVVGLVYLYGLVLGALWLGWQWFVNDNLPKWNWWQFLLAPLAIGAIAAALEKFGEFLANGFTFSKETQPRWKKNLALLILFIFLAALVLGPAFYQIGHR